MEHVQHLGVRGHPDGEEDSEDERHDEEEAVEHGGDDDPLGRAGAGRGRAVHVHHDRVLVLPRVHRHLVVAVTRAVRAHAAALGAHVHSLQSRDLWRKKNGLFSSQNNSIRRNAEVFATSEVSPKGTRHWTNCLTETPARELLLEAMGQ